MVLINNRWIRRCKFKHFLRLLYRNIPPSVYPIMSVILNQQHVSFYEIRWRSTSMTFCAFFFHWWISFTQVTLYGKELEWLNAKPPAHTWVVQHREMPFPVTLHCCLLTIVLSDWLESFNPGREDLDPARQGQMLSNYLCIFTTNINTNIHITSTYYVNCRLGWRRCF